MNLGKPRIVWGGSAWWISLPDHANRFPPRYWRQTGTWSAALELVRQWYRARR